MSSYPKITLGLPKQKHNQAQDGQKRHEVEQLKTRIKDFANRWDVKSVSQHGSSPEARASASKALLALATYLSATPPRAYPRAEIRHVMQQDVQWRALLPHLLSAAAPLTAAGQCDRTASHSAASCATSLILLARCLPGLIVQQSTAGPLCCLLNASCHPATTVREAAEALLTLLPQWTFTSFWQDWQAQSTSSQLLDTLSNWLPATDTADADADMSPTGPTKPFKQVDLSRADAATSVVRLISKVLAISPPAVEDFLQGGALARWLSCLSRWMEQACPGGDYDADPDLASLTAALLELMCSYLAPRQAASTCVPGLNTALMFRAIRFVSRAGGWLKLHTVDPAACLKMQLAVADTLHFLACPAFWASCCHTATPLHVQPSRVDPSWSHACSPGLRSAHEAQLAASQALTQHLQYLMQAAVGAHTQQAGDTQSNLGDSTTSEYASHGAHACRVAAACVCAAILSAATPEHIYGEPPSPTPCVCPGIRAAADHLISDVRDTKTLVHVLLQLEAEAVESKVGADVLTLLSPLHAQPAAARPHGIASIHVQQVMHALIASQAQGAVLEELSKALQALRSHHVLRTPTGMQQHAANVWAGIQDLLSRPTAAQRSIPLLPAQLDRFIAELRTVQVTVAVLTLICGAQRSQAADHQHVSIQQLPVVLPEASQQPGSQVDQQSLECLGHRDLVPQVLLITAAACVQLMRQLAHASPGVIQTTHPFPACAPAAVLHVSQLLCLRTCLACLLQLVPLQPSNVNCSDLEACLSQLTSSSSKPVSLDGSPSAVESEQFNLHGLLEQLVTDSACTCLPLSQSWQHPACPLHHCSNRPASSCDHHQPHTWGTPGAKQHTAYFLSRLQQQLSGEVGCLAAAVLSRWYGQLGVPSKHLHRPWGSSARAQHVLGSPQADDDLDALQGDVQLVLKGSSLCFRAHGCLLAASSVLASKVHAARSVGAADQTLIIQLSASVPQEVLASILEYVHTGACHVAAGQHLGRPAAARDTLLKVARSLGLTRLAAFAKAKAPPPGSMLTTWHGAPCTPHLIPTCSTWSAMGGCSSTLSGDVNLGHETVQSGCQGTETSTASAADADPSGPRQGACSSSDHPPIEQLLIQSTEWYERQSMRRALTDMAGVSVSALPAAADLLLAVPCCRLDEPCADSAGPRGDTGSGVQLIGVHKGVLASSRSPVLQAACSSRWLACVDGKPKGQTEGQRDSTYAAAAAGPGSCASREGVASDGPHGTVQHVSLPVIRLPEVLDADVAWSLIAYEYTGQLHLQTSFRRPCGSLCWQDFRPPASSHDVATQSVECCHVSADLAAGGRQYSGCQCCARMRTCLRVAHCARALLLDGLHDLCVSGLQDVLLSHRLQVPCNLTLLRDAALLDLSWALAPLLEQLAAEGRQFVESEHQGSSEWCTLPPGLKAASSAVMASGKM